jgi:hypothetical protein
MESQTPPTPEQALLKVSNLLFLNPNFDSLEKFGSDRARKAWQDGYRKLKIVSSFEVSFKKIKERIEQFIDKEIETEDPCNVNVKLREIMDLIRKARYREDCQEAELNELEKTIEEKDISRIKFYVKMKPNTGEKLSETVQEKLDSKTYLKKIDNTSNEDAFQTIKNNVEKSMESTDDTVVLAYGPTGSGKTYTLHGSKDAQGVTEKIIEKIFENGELMVKCRFLEFKMTKNNFQQGYEYVECYRNIENKKPDQYVSMKDNMAKVWLNKDNPITQAWGRNTRDSPTINQEEFWKKYKNAIQNREHKSTDKNDDSSRSHFLIAIKIYKGSKANGTVYILDLAGTEDIRKRMLHFLNTNDKISNFSLDSETTISKKEGFFSEDDYDKMKLYQMRRPKNPNDERLTIYDEYHETVGLARSIHAIFRLLEEIAKEIPREIYKERYEELNFMIFKKRNITKFSQHRVKKIPMIENVNSPTIALSHTGFFNGLDWMLRDDPSNNAKTRIAVFICLDPRDEERSMHALNLLPESNPLVLEPEYEE